MLRALHGLGVRETVMLTGDAAPTARVIAAEAGIDAVRAELLPHDKVVAFKELATRHGCVVMVGDGINDAPALATATVGVAMGAQGAGISAEAADIVLLKDDVTGLVDVMRAGRRMRRVALQSVAFGIGASAALMAVAVFGLIPPTLGALCQEAIDVAAVLNALRARGGD
jgi:P-type E1-E2 ATPase